MTIRRYQSRSISHTVEKLTRPIFGERGFSSGKILSEWPNIVGALLSKHTFPEKISYPLRERINGTLFLRIDSPALSLELQHMEVQLLEKINIHFGFKAVTRIKLLQGTLPTHAIKEPKPKRKLTENEHLELSNKLDKISDPDLKQALQALGSEVKTNN